MSDGELIYSFLVQANPVPEPEALSEVRPSPVPASVLLEEEVMDTKTDHAPTTGSAPKQSRWRGPALLAGAAAVVLLIVGGVALLATIDEGPQQGWSVAASGDPALADSLMLDAIAGGPGFIAVGTDSFREDARAWTSPDGSVWERAEIVGAGPGVINGVAEGGPGYVAVGIDPSLDAPAVWTSSDGRSWERVPHDEEALTANRTMLDIAAFGGGLVAVGTNSGPPVGGGAVWLSADGITWEQIDSSFSGAVGTVLTAVANTGGTLTAVGGWHVENSPVIYTSSDGRDWIQAYRGGIDDGGLDGLASGPDRVVTAGFGDRDVGRGPAAVVLVDGDWRRALVAVEGEVTDVAFIDGHYVAVGFVDDLPGINRSVDGLTWTSVDADLGTGRMLAVAADRSGLLVVGSDGADGAVWRFVP